MKVKCRNHCHRKAIWPKRDPRWCTKKCAADWAMMMTGEDHFCQQAGVWVEKPKEDCEVCDLEEDQEQVA